MTMLRIRKEIELSNLLLELPCHYSDRRLVYNNSIVIIIKVVNLVEIQLVIILA